MSRQPIDGLLEDQILLEAIRLRDKKVFEEFYKKYYRQLFAMAYQYVEKVEAAEEIVHDVFINIWNKADQLNIQYSMKSYLFKAIVNTSLNFIKKEKMDMEKRVAYLAVQDHESEPDDNNEREEILLKNLEHALLLLPEKCRQVMYLSRFGKLKQQEIADQMEISLKTVKNHLTYGFRKLREHLEKYGQVITAILLYIKIILR